MALGGAGWHAYVTSLSNLISSIDWPISGFNGLNRLNGSSGSGEGLKSILDSDIKFLEESWKRHKRVRKLIRGASEMSPTIVSKVSKMCPKCVQNVSKMCPKCVRNVSKMCPKSV